MTLALTVDSLDTIPENLRSLYVERDGRYHLPVEGLEDTSALKGALKKERDAAKAARTAAAQYEGLGLSADEIRELVETKRKGDEENARKRGDFDALLAQHKADWQRQLEAITGERDTALKSERAAVVGTSLLSALTKAGATEEGIELLPDRLAGRIKYETQDGKRVLSIVSADGETPLAGSQKDGTATFDDLVKEAVSKYPSLFRASGHGGSGMQPQHKAAGSGKTMPRAQFESLSPLDKAATMKAGVRLTD